MFRDAASSKYVFPPSARSLIVEAILRSNLQPGGSAPHSIKRDPQRNSFTQKPGALYALNGITNSAPTAGLIFNAD